MRAIKFRAWNKKKKEWLFDYDKMGAFSLFGECVMLGEFSSIPLSRLNDIAIMQFTGLKDRNGNEIYEGDVVASHNGVAEGVVVYQAPKFIIQWPKRKTWHEFILSPEQNQFEEILGNIYENPELGRIPAPQSPHRTTLV